MKQIGYVLSGCDQSKVSFVVMEDCKVYVNNYYFINHPSSSTGEFNPVLLRVYKITPYNPEMTIGSFGPIAGKKGEKAYYGKKLEYLVAWAEVLGYISWDGKWRRLECSPNTWDSVYEPTYEELEGFFVKLSSKSLSDRADFPIAIGRHRGLNIPFHLDLNAIAKGHMFVAGMTRSGKSTFVLNLIARALESDLKPRFIIFDRRCEYSLLSKYGAAIFPYLSFIPKTELISPSLITSRLGLDPNKAEGKLLCEALNSMKAEGSDLTAKNVFKRCVELAPYLISRSRDSVLSRIRWALEKRGDLIFTEEHKPLNIVETLYDKPAVIVDFSADANIEDQQLTAKYLIREVVDHAIKCRTTGDFATIFVIEEAQYFIPERGLKIEVGNPEKTGVDKQIIEAISQAGGYNVGFIIVTQRPAYISKSVISQCNTIAAFRLIAGNDQEAIIKYSEYGSERMSDYLPGLADHEALIWGMASPVPFPVTIEVDVKDYPSKTGVTAKTAWDRMKIKTPTIKIQQ